MEQIFAFLKNLYEEHLYLILAGVIVLALLIFFIIVISVKKKKAKEKKTKETFIQKSVQALTPQEIENISNNSANPVIAKETLTAEVVELNVNVEPTKEEVKPSVEPKKQEVKKAEPKKAVKQPVKTEPKAEPKKAETQPKEVKKAEPKKAEAQPAKKAEPKVETKKAEPKKAEPKLVENTEDKKNYLGKWKIKDDENGFFACLTASNGVLVLQTEYYKSLSGVKNGIETIKKNVDDGNFAISVDKYGHYRYKLLSQSNRVICISEDYSSKAKCESGIESVKRFAKTAIVIREEQEK